MKRLFYILSIFMLMALNFSMVESAVAGAAKTNAACGADCKAMRSARTTTPKPTQVALVCIDFAQRQPGPVVLTIYGKDNRELRRLAKQAPRIGKFCIGRAAWMVPAERIILCNRDITRVAKQEQINSLLEHGGTKTAVELWRNK